MSRRNYDESGVYEEDRIYCLSDDNSTEMQLVLKNRWIGNMTPDGDITEFHSPKLYTRQYLPAKEKPKKQKVEVQKTEKEKERGKRVEVQPIEDKFDEFVATSVDDILTAAMNDNWYKELMYNG